MQHRNVAGELCSSHAANVNWGSHCRPLSVSSTHRRRSTNVPARGRASSNPCTVTPSVAAHDPATWAVFRRCKGSPGKEVGHQRTHDAATVATRCWAVAITDRWRQHYSATMGRPPSRAPPPRHEGKCCAASTTKWLGSSRISASNEEAENTLLSVLDLWSRYRSGSSIHRSDVVYCRSPRASVAGWVGAW